MDKRDCEMQSLFVIHQIFADIFQKIIVKFCRMLHNYFIGLNKIFIINGACLRREGKEEYYEEKRTLGETTSYRRTKTGGRGVCTICKIKISYKNNIIQKPGKETVSNSYESPDCLRSVFCWACV